jgi:hypothetical protein
MVLFSMWEPEAGLMQVVTTRYIVDTVLLTVVTTYDLGMLIIALVLLTHGLLGRLSGIRVMTALAQV